MGVEWHGGGAEQHGSWCGADTLQDILLEVSVIHLPWEVMPTDNVQQVQRSVF